MEFWLIIIAILAVLLVINQKVANRRAADSLLPFSMWLLKFDAADEMRKQLMGSMLIFQTIPILEANGMINARLAKTKLQSLSMTQKKMVAEVIIISLMESYTHTKDERILSSQARVSFSIAWIKCAEDLFDADTLRVLDAPYYMPH